MWTTPSHEVASGLRLAFLAVTVLATFAEPIAGELETPTPASPATAAMTTSPAAAMPTQPSRDTRTRRSSPAFQRFQSLPSAPWRIGFSR